MWCVSKSINLCSKIESGMLVIGWLKQNIGKNSKSVKIVLNPNIKNIGLHAYVVKWVSIKPHLNQYEGVRFVWFQLDFLLLLIKIASPTKQIPELKITNDKVPNTK